MKGISLIVGAKLFLHWSVRSNKPVSVLLNSSLFPAYRRNAALGGELVDNSGQQQSSGPGTPGWPPISYFELLLALIVIH